MPLRVIGGTARGATLRQPRGTRPTSARLREALFSMLEAAGVDLARVADLYAGSGALGIEALSRGAEACTFVEASRGAVVSIRENLERTGFADRATIVGSRVERWRPNVEAPYTLVVADPPYDDAAAWQTLEDALASAVDARTTLVVERASRDEAPGELLGLQRWRSRQHGDGAVTIYRDRASDDEGAHEPTLD